MLWFMINMHLLYFNASYKTGLAAILMPIAAEQRGREHHASATNSRQRPADYIANLRISLPACPTYYK